MCVCALVATVGDAQAGAVPGEGTIFPGMTASLYMANARARGVSAGLVFTDIMAAFYSCWPELALGGLISAARRAVIFAQANIASD